MKTAVFLADIGYLVKQLSNHYTTLCPKNLEKLSNFEDWGLNLDTYNVYLFKDSFIKINETDWVTK